MTFAARAAVVMFLQDNQTPKRTAAATAARMRRQEETAAELLRSRGWEVRSPEESDRDLIVSVGREMLPDLHAV